MELFKGDLHIHTVLSPCADLEMSPRNILSCAKKRDIKILGISDHNSTRQCRTMKKLAAEEEIFILCGAEVTTKEEVHCLVFFEEQEQLDEFDQYIYNHLAEVRNDPDKFGHQVVVDEDEQILDQPEKLLLSATDLTIEQLEKVVHKEGGIFIPAHIDRVRNGILGMLGFIPPDLNYDALELSRFTDYTKFVSDNPLYSEAGFIHSSDAHYPDEVGQATTNFLIKEPSFSEIKKAIHKIDGRAIKI